MITIKICPLCKSEDRQPFDRRTFRGREVTNQLCRTCGLVYQSPRPSDSELEDFYRQEYRLLYQGTADPGRKDLVIQHGRAESLLHYLKDKTHPPRRHLDIGASAGVLVMRIQDHFHCQSEGVEPGEAYRYYAERQGLHMHDSLETARANLKQRFDLVTMAHVLEHLPDPVGYLRTIREHMLEPAGRLLVEVPNLYGHDCFEVAHLAGYSVHTLRQVLAKSGFQVLDVSIHGQPRSVVLPLYITLLARPQKNSEAAEQSPVRRERAVRLKRRIGLSQRRFFERLFPGLAWLPTP